MEVTERFPFSIVNNILIGEEVPSRNEDVNIGELILNALKSQPNFVAQVNATNGKEITFQEIRNKSVKLAMWMKRSGIRAGDEIVISSNHYAVMYVFFASLFIGAIPTLWHENHKLDTVRDLIFDAVRKMMFIDDTVATEFFDELLEENYGRDKIVVVFGIFTAFIPYDDLVSKIDTRYNQKVIDEFICVQLNKNERNIATILYTRGASHFSKPIDIPHTTFMAAVNQQVFDMLPTGVGMWVGSFSSLINMMLAVYSILSCKRTIRFTGYREEEVCQTLEKYKANWVLLETYMCRDIVNSDLLNKHNLSSLKMLLFSGSPISYNDHSNLIKSLPNTSIISLYYTTETGIISCQAKTGKIRSSGYVGKNSHVKIVERRNKVRPYVSGEIWYKCKDITNAYHDYHEQPMELFNVHGWCKTGDVGYFDEDGDIFVLERTDDIILYRNTFFSPNIIENVISRNNSVVSVAVVAVTDRNDYEHPVAFISKKPRKQLNIQKLMDEVKNKLSNSMRLRGGVKLLLEMPYSLSGDIDRCLLREIANEDKFAALQNQIPQ